MARAWWKHTLAALAAGATLGGLVLAPAAQAQQAGVPTSSQALLATMQSTELGGGAACSKLGDNVVYTIADDSPTRPAVIVLVHPGAEAASPGAMEALAERFLRAYKLSGYRIVSARDRRAAFLFRESGMEPKGTGGQRVVRALSKGLAPAIGWLNSLYGGAPHRVEGTTLVWRKEVHVSGDRRELEVTLNLLRGKACYVELRLGKANLAAVAELLTRQMNLPLEQVGGSKGSSLRKKLGSKPFAYFADKKTEPSLVLLRSGGEPPTFRLGGVNVLAALREQRGKDKDAEPSLPELSSVPWADEMGKSGAEEKPAPTPGSAEPAPQAQPDREDATPKPQPPEPGASPGKIPTPAEAREEYAKKLRAL